MERIFEIAAHFGLSMRAAEAAGWTALAVECAPCGTTTHIALSRLIAGSRYGFAEEVVARMRCHACGAAPAAAYYIKPIIKTDPLKPLTYRVEEWSEGGVRPVELLAATSNGVIGRVAFGQAIEERPGRVLMLRQGARVLLSTLSTPPPSNVRPFVAKIDSVDQLPQIRHRRAG